MIKADVSHITEEWVRENINIEERRSTIRNLLYSCELHELLDYSEKEVPLYEFMGKINAKVNDIKDRYARNSDDIRVMIQHQYGFDHPELSLLIVEFTPEPDSFLIKRIIQSEKQKIRRKAAKKRRDESIREKELAEYRRLKKKYGIINTDPVS